MATPIYFQTRRRSAGRACSRLARGEEYLARVTEEVHEYLLQPCDPPLGVFEEVPVHADHDRDGFGNGWPALCRLASLSERRMSLLRRIADYEPPWVGRVGLALVVVLWLFVTAVGFAVGAATGLAFLIVGAALIGGEVWIERTDGRHATFVLVWRSSWRIGVGLAVIVSGLARSDGWAAAVAAIFGAWLILSGLVFARLRWLEMRAAPDE